MPTPLKDRTKQLLQCTKGNHDLRTAHEHGQCFETSAGELQIYGTSYCIACGLVWHWSAGNAPRADYVYDEATIQRIRDYESKH